jgi:hypothetical protein
MIKKNFNMHAQKLPRFERHRRRQAIGLTIGFGLIAAALAGAAIYFLYQSSHIKM